MECDAHRIGAEDPLLRFAEVRGVDGPQRRVPFGKPPQCLAQHVGLDPTSEQVHLDRGVVRIAGGEPFAHKEAPLGAGERSAGVTGPGRDGPGNTAAAVGPMPQRLNGAPFVDVRDAELGAEHRPHPGGYAKGLQRGHPGVDQVLIGP